MRFRIRPIEVDARQWAGGAEAATPIIDWILGEGGTARYNDYSVPESESIVIDGASIRLYARPGDWIVRGVDGQFYTCQPDAFDESYEPVE